MTHLGMTPHFTIRVWSCLDRRMDEMDRLLGLPRRCEPVAEIEVDTTEWDGQLTISGHWGLDLIPQKMLTS
jgi:hypothetical protein